MSRSEMSTALAAANLRSASRSCSSVGTKKGTSASRGRTTVLLKYPNRKHQCYPAQVYVSEGCLQPPRRMCAPIHIRPSVHRCIREDRASARSNTFCGGSTTLLANFLRPSSSEKHGVLKNRLILTPTGGMTTHRLRAPKSLSSKHDNVSIYMMIIVFEASY